MQQRTPRSPGTPRHSNLPARAAALLAALAAAAAILSVAAAAAGRGITPAPAASPAGGQAAGAAIPLESLAGLELVQVKADMVDFHGRRAVHLVDDAPRGSADGHTVAILGGTDFADGAISVDVAGNPRPGAPDSRGFVGLAFRIRPHGTHFECIYLRMTNGRSDDPVRRNHVVQYISYPDFLFARLRQERPGVYEAPGNVDPSAWNHMKIVVAGSHASLYLQGAAQPALQVLDLKLGAGRGGIGLWVGTETNGYFSNLSVEPAAGAAQSSKATAAPSSSLACTPQPPRSRSSDTASTSSLRPAASGR